MVLGTGMATIALAVLLYRVDWASWSTWREMAKLVTGNRGLGIY
jgi:hypothetical protein